MNLGARCLIYKRFLHFLNRFCKHGVCVGAVHWKIYLWFILFKLVFKVYATKRVSSSCFLLKVSWVCLNISTTFEPSCIIFMKFAYWKSGYLPSDFVQIRRFRQVQDVETSSTSPTTLDFEKKPRSITMRINIVFQ